MLEWHDLGRFAVDRRVFDVGIQTGTALPALREGTPALEAGPAEERTNGNGSLMRVLPLALWHLGSDAELVADARLQSRVTHGHLRSQACCALYCLWARRVMEGSENPWSEAVAALRGLWADEPASLAVLEESIRPDDPPGGRGGGYVVDCLHSARWAVEAGPYEQVVKAAVAIGDDTDTTACVAGGIAGLRDGVAAIPERWRRALRGREWLDPLLGALLERDSVRPAPDASGPSRNRPLTSSPDRRVSMHRGIRFDIHALRSSPARCVPVAIGTQVQLKRRRPVPSLVGCQSDRPSPK